MAKKILLGLAGVIALVLVLAAFRPSSFRVERSIVIQSSAEKIFPLVNNFHHWENWSPWAKLDPQAKVQYEGPESGVGAAFSWDGNKEVGAGKMTMTESTPASQIQYRLDFLKPFQATNMAGFTLTPEGDHTKVTWAMWGDNNYISKIFGLFMNCDKMIGGEFEKGLQQLKDLSEKS